MNGKVLKAGKLMGQLMIVLKGILCILCLSAAVAGQSLILEGKIRDANTHQDISGVSIYIEELDIGTVSNASGRFRIEIMRPEPEMMVTFQHIAYDSLQMMVEDVLSSKIIELHERLILLPAVSAESIEDQLEIEKDIPQNVAVLNARIFDLHGYLDAGDLLRTDQSIQIDEELSGKKTASIRGGNSDEVIVLYNGIRMNNALDNIFDLSLIDLTDVARLEIIKGSNTALYGSEAFSGVINVIPRSLQDYKVRFQQRIGSHNSGDWGLHLYNNIGKLHGGYSLKRGSSQRKYLNEPTGRNLLENRSEHHTASLSYHFSESPSGQPISSLGLMYIRSDLNYENERDSETLTNFNQMITARYTGDVGNFTDVSISGAYQWLDESQFLRYADTELETGFLSRGIKNRAWHFNADKTFRFRNVKLLVGYQFDQTRLDFKDNRFAFSNDAADLDVAALKRQNHGFISIAKLSHSLHAGFLRNLNFDLSFRHDVVNDKEIVPISGNIPGFNTSSIIGDSEWNKSTVKLSTHTSGGNANLAVKSFLNLGTNIKFPTLLQQISTREMLASSTDVPLLNPETNQSVELGVDITRETRKDKIFGWQISANVFHNQYKNKFRGFTLPGTPIAFYDNVKSARISGFETRQKLFLYRKKVTFEFGASRYFLSDLAVFPFKQDRKYTFDIQLDQEGYSLRIHAFKEGRQVAQIRNLNGGFSEISIASVGNLDIFFSKSFEINKLKLFFNASLRNLVNDDFELEGLTLRDRRYYFTLGIQY